MTQEQIELVNKILEQEVWFKPFATALYFTLIIAFVLTCLYWLYNLKKRQQYRREWLATLTDEQRKAIEESKKFNI